jgi:YHS domain-containing protein
MRGLIAGLGVVWALGGVAVAGSVDEVPAAFLPFEHMIGGWKGIAKPASNPLKGWQESHGWAWKFEKGKPVGLTVTLEGDKTLAKGAISFDSASKKYKLDGTDASGKAIAFLGSWSTDGKTLTFDRVGATPEGKERLTFRPTSNKIRYTLNLDRQEPGAPQYKSVISVGLTKDGENFAAGGGGADLPKCIMTGGAAGLSVSYNGKSYPVCCTGCRDEFNDNPEKYAKLADLAAKNSPAKDGAAKAKPASKGKDDGSFDGLIDEPETKKAAMPAKEKPAAKPAETKTAKAKDDTATKAARELQLGQNFDKDGKTKLALEHYRTVVKDYPDTEAAKTAAARIKSLEGK